MKSFKLLFASLALAFIVLLSPVSSQPVTRAAGARYVTTTGNDANDCLSPATPCASINGALAKPGFTDGDTIKVAIGTYYGTGTEVVLLNRSANLFGGWDASFTTQSGMSTIDGQGARKGVTINSGVNAYIEKFVVQNGSECCLTGAGIKVDGNLTVHSSTIISNTGEGIYISGSGNLSINNSTVSRNCCSQAGSGIFNMGYLTVTRSTISDNHVGGIVNYSGAPVTINESTISGNTGGIINDGSGSNLIIKNTTIYGNSYDRGGGIITSWGNVTLINSTLSGNNASLGGGIYNYQGTTSIYNSTIVSNTAQYGSGNYGGGGIDNDSGIVTMQNSILAGNSNINGADCVGVINSLGYNILGNTFLCALTGGIGDQRNVDAAIGPLQNNGGSTATHALMPNSPAIDAGNPNGCDGNNGLVFTDQRGFPRIRRCDIGAFEDQFYFGAIKSSGKSSIFSGDSLSYYIELANSGLSNITNVLVTDTLPINLKYIPNSLVAPSGTANYNNGTITWNGTLNAATTLTITFNTVASASTSTPITNTVTINGAGRVFNRTARTDVIPRFAYVPLITKNYSPPTPTPTPTPVPLPLSLYGHVTLNGSNIGGVPLDLRFYNGSSWFTTTNTTTSANGSYSFTNVPGVSPGQYYYVRYLNGSDTNRLCCWSTRLLGSASSGQNVAAGDFDIANIALQQPAPGSTVPLPNQFQWTARPATPTDNYEFDLYNPPNTTPYWYTPPLGYVGGYTLNGLPGYFNYWTKYYWYVGVFSPDGGYGSSYYAYQVTFQDSGGGGGNNKPIRLAPSQLRPQENFHPKPVLKNK